MADPFSNTVGIPVGQEEGTIPTYENLALDVARSGAARSGACRSGFVAAPGDTYDLHQIPVDGSVTGPDYAWRDRALLPGTPNQPPTIGVNPGPFTVSWAQTIVFDSNNPIIMDDVDNNGGTEQLDFAVTNGTVTLGTIAGIAIVAGANGTSALTIRGTITTINNAINGLIFTPAHVVAQGKIVFTANDLGNSGSGGPLTFQTTTTFSIIQGGG